MDVIKYKDKEYQLSVTLLKHVGSFAIYIFPIESNIVSNHDVFSILPYNLNRFIEIMVDIKNHPEKYVSDKAIKRYLECKNCGEWCCTLCMYGPNGKELFKDE